MVTACTGNRVGRSWSVLTVQRSSRTPLPQNDSSGSGLSPPPAWTPPGVAAAGGRQLADARRAHARVQAARLRLRPRRARAAEAACAGRANRRRARADPSNRLGDALRLTASPAAAIRALGLPAAALDAGEDERGSGDQRASRSRPRPAQRQLPLALSEHAT